MNYSFFIAKKVAAEGEQSFARVIIRIAVIAIALSITVMICATALVTGFKREISSKIFGFWGHIHITNASVYENLLEESWLDKNQAFYPHLDTITRVSYVENQKILGREVKRVKHTNGGVRHIQVYAFKGGIIKAKDEIEGIFLKGVGKDFDWQFLSQYLVEGRAIQMEDTVASNEILISRTTSNRLKVAVGMYSSCILYKTESNSNAALKFVAFTKRVWKNTIGNLRWSTFVKFSNYWAGKKTR
nr:hypothetical protein [Haliscomenobacter sp.]